MTTLDQLNQVEAEIERLLPERVRALTPVLLAEGAKKPLTAAPQPVQEQIVCQRDPEFAALLKQAQDLNLRWNIEEGMY